MSAGTAIALCMMWLALSVLIVSAKIELKEDILHLHQAINEMRELYETEE